MKIIKCVMKTYHKNVTMQQYINLPFSLCKKQKLFLI